MLPARRFNGQYGLTDFFNDFFDNRNLEKIGVTAPAINVKENDKGYKIEVAAPGMCKDDFKIHLNKEGNLVIDMEKTDCGCKEKDKDGKEVAELTAHDFVNSAQPAITVKPCDVNISMTM